MKRLNGLILVVLVCSASWAEEKTPDATKPVIEKSMPMQSDVKGLGTKGYEPTEREIMYLKKIVQDEKNEKKEEDRYGSLQGQTGKYVGWFGIVREIEEDKDKKETRLLLEHKYFDGLTDLHIHIVSYYGGGDFKTVLPGTGMDIKKLDLLCVYGTVCEEKEKIPNIKAEYARQWSWGLFTFMDYGNDKSNPKWKALRKVKGEDSYSPRPSKAFYEARLGIRDEDTKSAKSKDENK